MRPISGRTREFAPVPVFYELAEVVSGIVAEQLVEIL